MFNFCFSITTQLWSSSETDHIAVLNHSKLFQLFKIAIPLPNKDNLFICQFIIYVCFCFYSGPVSLIIHGCITNSTTHKKRYIAMTKKNDCSNKLHQKEIYLCISVNVFFKKCFLCFLMFSLFCRNSWKLYCYNVI